MGSTIGGRASQNSRATRGVARHAMARTSFGRTAGVARIAVPKIVFVRSMMMPHVLLFCWRFTVESLQCLVSEAFRRRVKNCASLKSRAIEL